MMKSEDSFHLPSFYAGGWMGYAIISAECFVMLGAYTREEVMVFMICNAIVFTVVAFCSLHYIWTRDKKDTRIRLSKVK